MSDGIFSGLRVIDCASWIAGPAARVPSAHTSGWSPDRQVRLIDVFADNVRRFTTGQPLMSVVDKQKGY